MHETVFLDRSTVAPQIAPRRPAFARTLIERQRTAPGELLHRLAGATIAIVNKVQRLGEVPAKLRDLKLIAVAATGTDCVDKACCQAHGIAVTDIRGYTLRTVPEHTFALVLAHPSGAAAIDGALMRIARRRNVVVTPHVARASEQAQQALADQLTDNIENSVAGKSTNPVSGAFRTRHPSEAGCLHRSRGHLRPPPHAGLLRIPAVFPRPSVRARRTAEPGTERCGGKPFGAGQAASNRGASGAASRSTATAGPAELV